MTNEEMIAMARSRRTFQRSWMFGRSEYVRDDLLLLLADTVEWFAERYNSPAAWKFRENEELIYKAREIAFNARMDYSSSGEWLDELADALEEATATTEYGVLFHDSEGYDEPVWLAEDEYEARAEAMGHDGKMMTRTVGPWDEVE
jgi:hypothetical protein